MPHKKYHTTTKDAWPGKELFLFEPRTLLIIIITSVVTLLIAFFGQSGTKFLTSVLSPVPPHAPFDGTVYPVQEVPNWVLLTEAQRKVTFSQLPKNKLIAPPLYEPSHLTQSLDGLTWNNAKDDAIRNEKITYSVPYLGNYRLDGKENVGSHPAVDIKVPEGTPVYAMANGTVIKAQISNGGFGNHIVLQHNDMPLLDDASRHETLYSSYSHMSVLSVHFHEVVRKGQLIGFSGQTGTATTPHVHFQIDRDSAAWHPYWPFSTADMNAAGYSFFQAINNGLQLENARVHTLNPLRYVQKYLDPRSVSVAVVPSSSVQPPASPAPQQPSPVTPPPAAPSPVLPSVAPPEALAPIPYDHRDVSFVLQTLGATVVPEGQDIPLMIQAFDSSGNLLTRPSFSSSVTLSLVNNTGSTLEPSTLTASHFQTGVAEGIRVTKTKPGVDRVILRFGDREFVSSEFEIMPRPLDATASIEPKPEETVEVIAAPTTPDTTSSASTSVPVVPEVTPPAPSAEPSFTDVPVGSEYDEALRLLKQKGLVTGYPDGTFKPAQAVSRAEAVAFILRAIGETISATARSTFPDVKDYAWYDPYVAKAFELGFIDGYPDGTFGAELTVNGGEFWKMLLNASKVDVDPVITLALPAGVSSTDWFAPYLQEVLRKNIVDPSAPINPGEPLTRGAIAQMIYRMEKVR